MRFIVKTILRPGCPTPKYFVDDTSVTVAAVSKQKRQISPVDFLDQFSSRMEAEQIADGLNQSMDRLQESPG